VIVHARHVPRAVRLRRNRRRRDQPARRRAANEPDAADDDRYGAAVLVTVRELTIDDDLPAFGRMVLASYTALPGRPHDPEYDAELLDVTGRVGKGVVLGAFDGDQPLGCVTYVNDPSSPHAERLDDDEASFRMLAVDVAAQGRRIGETLTISCIDRARAAQRAAVFICSGDWMTTAHRLYGRLGFVRQPERDWQVERADVRLLGFRLDLS
jgi:ribosomal protein S18 acetylase RimI-like enzyme